MEFKGKINQFFSFRSLVFSIHVFLGITWKAKMFIRLTARELKKHIYIYIYIWVITQSGDTDNIHFFLDYTSSILRAQVYSVSNETHKPRRQCPEADVQGRTRTDGNTAQCTLFRALLHSLLNYELLVRNSTIVEHLPEYQ